MVATPQQFLDLPHHDGSALHVPVQRPRLGDTVPVLVRVPRTYAEEVRRILVRSLFDAEPRFRPAVVSHEDVHDVWWRADLLVHNPVTSYRFLLEVGPTSYRWLNGTGVHDHDVTDASDFRVTTFEPAPEWTREAVIYQIFPDRFARSASAPTAVPEWATPAGWDDPVVHEGPQTPLQLFGGDLRGIEEHLDHLAGLGVDVVYLTPVFPGESNHRYNASTFDQVDPLLGGNEALASLTAAAHRRGMKVVGDLTTNHTGDTHEWFTAAVGHPERKEASYYYFRDHPADYVAWFDEPTLPKLNHGAPGLRERLLTGPDSVAATWLRPPYSLDGWRIDVANMTGRHGADDYNHPVARDLRATMARENPDTWLVAEHNHDTSSDLQGDGWHGAMNYAAFTRPVWSWLNTPGHGRTFLGVPLPVPVTGAEQSAATMRAFAAAVPWRTVTQQMNLLGSHDTPRVRTIVGSAERQTVAAGILFTYPGVPMFFMGDELGFEGLDGEHARTPMPWHDGDLLGGEMARTYRELIALRRAQAALREGGLRWAYAAGDALAYLRETADERLLVLAARAPHEPVRLPGTLLLSSAGPRTLYGPGSARVLDGMVELPGDGPAFHVFAL